MTKILNLVNKVVQQQSKNDGNHKKLHTIGIFFVVNENS